MRKFLLSTALLGLLGFASISEAQSSLTVDFHKASFTWQWAAAPAPNEGTPTEFRVKCGATSGVYTITKVVPGASTRTIKVDQVIAAPGSYVCAVFAANQFGESGASNEVTFSAGTTPGPANNFAIQAQ